MLTPICDCTANCGDDPFIPLGKCMPCDSYFCRQRLSIIEKCRQEALSLLMEATVHREHKDHAEMMNALNTGMDWTIHRALLQLTREDEYKK